MSKLKSVLIALALTGSVVTATSTASEAASPKITIHKIADKTVKASSKTAVRPHVSRGSHVTISSKTITVKKDGDVIVDHEASARLKPGTYRVTISVAFTTYRLDADGTKTFSNPHHKSKTQTLKLKVKAKAKKKETDSDHACTTTSSGTCIQGGQFCPQAKYGESGWDADGRRYVCTGDSDHPHWMVP
ncbi:MAG: hypothetical protein JWR55_286 [Aeromicrobium sp.]|jgi:hypothetical protein|nr:hypothetical protein [Aeromicrobium sp.]